MSSERILTDLDQDVDLAENCTLPQILKQDLMDFMFWRKFIVEDREPEALFKIMDRAAVYDILSYIVSLGLSADSINEITRRYEEIETYLLDKEYGVWELAYPSSLYMHCIQALVYGKKEPCNQICIYSCLPRQIRFHVLYYEQLALHMEKKLNKLLLES